jgi:hypothetical protein
MRAFLTPKLLGFELPFSKEKCFLLHWLTEEHRTYSVGKIRDEHFVHLSIIANKPMFLAKR